MEDWEMKALELFPELLEEVDRNQGGPGGLWADLYFALVKAYEEEPVDDDFVGRIYGYAAWCFDQPQTNDVETDLSSATASGFIESIPLDKKVSGDLYRWLSIESFKGFENLFRYHLSDEEYRTFATDFFRKKESYSGAPRL